MPAPDQVVVRLTGDAGRPTLTRLVPALTRAAGHGTTSVVVDVAGARFQDGTALQALAGFSDAMAAAGRCCRVVGAPAVTRRLVREEGLAEHLELDGPLTGQDPVRPRPRPGAGQPAVAAPTPTWLTPPWDEIPPARPRPVPDDLSGVHGATRPGATVPRDRWR
ncbi:anti-anti-sigma regulatory factor [Geodermatophilus bullaregiensis]|uniref:STAS domain-containing protein n=1 Tax=Geodermatophilus bullaregiensis TaxID=1564160 RepID=UPI0019562BDA|nr:STAS domain-containing protein [Geodermatophilus bullaregiensis]MBM7807858.1 anti-anti-sigma regulatory factor [Geodermatophilus bullaregiensis]